MSDKPLTPMQRVKAAFPNAVYKVNTSGAPGGYIYFESNEKVGTIPKSSGCIGEGLTAALAWKDALRSLPAEPTEVFIGIDPAAPNGDHGVEVIMEKNEDGSRTVTSVRQIPPEPAKSGEPANSSGLIDRLTEMFGPRPRLGAFGKPLKPKGLRWGARR